MEPEHPLEADLGRLLRIGVSVAAAVVFAGAVWFLLRHGSEPLTYSHFLANPESSRRIADVFRGVAAGDSRALIQIGLLLLIATPVARVLFSLILFARIRDYAYCVITAIVLAILILSLR